jgi:hypothetical protein
MPYQCEVEGCGSEFRKKNQMKKHEVEHTGVKPYRCETVGYGALPSLASNIP